MSGTAGDLTLKNQTPPDGKKLLDAVGGDLRRVGIALGAIVGLVGMISVSNTLMMSVHHRMRELGLRSAIGWSRRKIALLVVIESGIAGAIAGILGSALGLGLASCWSWSQGWSPVVPTLLPAIVTLLGIWASFIGGVIPALRAASISPLSAMRS